MSPRARGGNWNGFSGRQRGDPASSQRRARASAFKAFIKDCGMTHVKTSPYCPQSNGKIERWHGTPLSLDDAHWIVGRYVEHCNTVRLHSAVGSIVPADKLEGRAEAILAARDAKLAAAREGRPLRRQQAREKNVLTHEAQLGMLHIIGETEASSAGEQTRGDRSGRRANRPGGDGHPSGGVGPTGSPNLLAVPGKDAHRFTHALENSDLPQASRSPIDVGNLSNSG